MSKLPRLTGKEVITALKKIDFDVIRIRGSHHFVQHPDGRCTVVPVHSGETLGIGLLNQILKDCQVDRDDFSDLI
jgi:predicted RNA binding protein YcfA (HicA-like mRNA interferase family)